MEIQQNHDGTSMAYNENFVIMTEKKTLALKIPEYYIYRKISHEMRKFVQQSYQN